MRISPLLATEWLLLLAATGILTLFEEFHPLVWAALGLMAGAWALRLARRDAAAAARSSELDAPLLLFLLSAASAVIIAYEPRLAFLQFCRLLAAVSLFYAVRALPPPGLCWLAGGFVLAAAGLAAYWPLQHDFSAAPVKLPGLSRLGIFLNSVFPPLPFGPEIHPNVAAGVLALALPFAVALALQPGQRLSWRAGASLAGALISGLIALALLLTGSRGAWLAQAGALGLAVLAGVQVRWFATPAARRGFWLAAALLAVVGAIVVLRSDPVTALLSTPLQGSRTAGDAGAGASFSGRLDLWREGLAIAGDYLFTGIGLRMYAMVHAAYGLLIHAPFIQHAHNLPLQIWIEQGLVGLLAFAWLMGAGAWSAWRRLGSLSYPAESRLPERQDRPAAPLAGGDFRPAGERFDQAMLLSLAGLFALIAALLHGALDVLFYVERTLPLIGLAAGFAFLPQVDNAPAGRARRRSPAVLAAIALPAVLAVAVYAIPALRTAWLANLGALQQTRAELSIYDPARFNERNLDQVRREVNLQPALSSLQSALARNPANRTAIQRLAAIWLSTGAYEPALALLEPAWQRGDESMATRLLLGDALAAAGRPAQAAEVMRGLYWASSRQVGHGWYRYMQHADFQRAAWAYETALLLAPDDANAARGLEMARSRIVQ